MLPLDIPPTSDAGAALPLVIVLALAVVVIVGVLFVLRRMRR